MQWLRYQVDLFTEILNNNVYRTKNYVVLSECLKPIFEPDIKWNNGVDEEKNEMYLNYLVVNYNAMTLLLNRLNYMLLHLNRKGVTQMVTDEGEALNVKQLDFMQNHLSNEEGFENEFYRFHQLLCYFKEDVMKRGSATFLAITDILDKSMQKGNAEENLFVKNLDKFFVHATDVECTSHFGDLSDMVNGIDCAFTYRGQNKLAHVKFCKNIVQAGEYYKVYGDSVELLGRGDYLVFVMPNNYIYVFDNDKSKIRQISGNELFKKAPDEGLSLLLQKDLLVDYKKVF